MSRHGPLRISWSSSRRGAALLLALLVVVSLSLAGAGAMRRASTGALRASQARFDEQARWLARDAEALALGWLEHRERSDEALVGHGVHEALGAAHEGLSIRMGAIDLTGLLRVDLLESFAAVGLPEAVRAIRLEPQPADAPPWLHEELESLALRDRPGESVRAFPDTLWTDEDGVVSLALWLTTRGSGAINVNTAPPELLRAALRGQEIGAAREALDARARGLSVPPGALARLSAGRALGSNTTREPALTSSTQHVGFLVEIAERGRLARWWLVAERGDRPPPVHREALPGDASPSAERAAWMIVESRRIDP